MHNLISTEIKKLKYPYIISVIIAILYSCLMIIPVTSGYSYNYNVEIWEESVGLFVVIFPLFAVIPTIWLMYFERKNGFIMYTQTRVSQKKYILTKWLVSSIGGALIVFLVSFVGLVISLFFLPEVQKAGDDYAIKAFGGYYLVNHPFLYGLILSFWRMVLGFLVATFGFSLSLFVNNIFIVLTGPFVYSMLESFILAISGVPYYRLSTSFAPHTLSQTVITVPRLLVGPTLLLVVTCGVVFYFMFIKKISIYEK
ncbi:hypothetical protein M3196_15090 [Fictibacillus nanhaiensis]|uniref:hypothetical protein n=1 Tax=Fictibacillus nanhaiensis TaxID=742169 RepID=UPI00203A481A|nr:hypothetical protein [Fictibacillus nanhaiensis]MCM3732978.1 hypothetical protein [Fictibacillus nanhaiensis]